MTLANGKGQLITSCHKSPDTLNFCQKFQVKNRHRIHPSQDLRGSLTSQGDSMQTGPIPWNTPEERVSTVNHVPHPRLGAGRHISYKMPHAPGFLEYLQYAFSKPPSVSGFLHDCGRPTGLASGFLHNAYLYGLIRTASLF